MRYHPTIATADHATAVRLNQALLNFVCSCPARAADVAARVLVAEGLRGKATAGCRRVER